MNESKKYTQISIKLREQGLKGFTNLWVSELSRFDILILYMISRNSKAEIAKRLHIARKTVDEAISRLIDFSISD